MLLTIIGPQFLSALRFVISNNNDNSHVGMNILLLLLCPFHLYFYNIKQVYLELSLKLEPNNEDLMKVKEDLKRTLNTHIKLELGLETIYQLTGQLILLLMSVTETPTQDGLMTMFKEGQDPMAFVLLIISIALSFYGCVSSHWKALTACRDHFPFKTRLISSLYCTIGCLTRVMAIIMFFSGPLGLFSVLRHFQGEQFPWHPYVYDLLYTSNIIVLGDGEPFDWNMVDRWQKRGTLYLEYSNGTIIRDDYGKVEVNPDFLGSPPDYTLYVGVTLGIYLLIFFAHIGLHMMVVYFAKSILSKTFSIEFNFLQKIIHCLENTNIAYNSKEWDDDKGDSMEHRKRMQSNLTEVLIMIVIKGIFNALLLIPNIYLGNDIKCTCTIYHNIITH